MSSSNPTRWPPAISTFSHRMTGLQPPANSGSDDAWHEYGVALQAERQHAAAAQAFLKAVNLAPHRAFSWLELARSLIKSSNVAMAAPILDQLSASAPNTWQIIHLQSLVADQQGDSRQATLLALQAGELYTTANAKGWLLLGRLYLEDMAYSLALAVLDKAHAADPDAIEPEWLRAFSCALPIYESEAQINVQLALYTERARILLYRLQQLPAERLVGLDYLISISHGLFLGYTGRNVREAQQLTGKLLQLVVAANTPLATQQPSSSADSRIRLAIVSETFYYHSNMKLRRSWLRRIDRTKFRLCLYHVGERSDHYTDEIRTLCDEFHHYPKDFNGVVAQLQKDAPQIIQYTNIGLNTLTLRLACLRLAPVQCTTWGHPITSGLDTIDYYLSSDLMEPSDAAAHYSEQLVRLPGLSVVPEPIFKTLPPRVFSRQDFGLKEEDVFYLCLQSLQKYLPAHDDIYAAIAIQVPNAKFVFIASDHANITQIMQARLQQSFAARGLDMGQHVTFLPTQDQPHYRALHQLADVTLDSLGWSGANTSFEALELGGLLLTCPVSSTGNHMRGQHTGAILEYMEVPELIATGEQDYVSKAIELGLNKDLRLKLRQKLQAALPSLYRDPGLGEALNSFYLKAASGLA